MPVALMDSDISPVPVNKVLYHLDSSTDPAGENSRCDIIFFHGLILEDLPWRTWTTDSECHPWPATWLTQELPQTRVFWVKYDQETNEVQRDEVQRVHSLARKLAEDLTSEQSLGLGKARTVLVGHGIGGSIIKHMLLTMESIAGSWDEAKEELQGTLRRFLSSIKGIYFYASLDIWEGLDCKVHRNPSPQRTNEEFRTFRRRRKIKTYELILGQQFLSDADGQGSKKSKIVAPYDVDKYQVATAEVNHDNICKPKDKADYRYRTLKRFIAGLIG